MVSCENLPDIWNFELAKMVNWMLSMVYAPNILIIPWTRPIFVTFVKCSKVSFQKDKVVQRWSHFVLHEKKPRVISCGVISTLLFFHNISRIFCTLLPITKSPWKLSPTVPAFHCFKQVCPCFRPFIACCLG